MIQRRKSKPLQIGDVTVGGDAPIVVQSMTSTDTADAAFTLRQVRELAELGCELVRVAVPNRDAAAGESPLGRRPWSTWWAWLPSLPSW